MQGETVHPWSMILSPHSFALRKYSHVQPVWKCAGMQEEDMLEMTRMGMDFEDVEDVAWYFRHKGGKLGGTVLNLGYVC